MNHPELNTNEPLTDKDKYIDRGNKSRAIDMIICILILLATLILINGPWAQNSTPTPPAQQNSTPTPINPS